MPRLAANLSTMFGEVSFLERFAAAARAGFRAVEFMFPYRWAMEDVAGRARENGLEVVLFNCPAGDWEGGERGIAALPDRSAECREGIRRAHCYAKALACTRLHLMAGAVPPGASRTEMESALLANVRYAADLVASDGIEIVLEAINTRVDVPGYFYATTDAVARFVDRVERPNVRLLFDVYHVQVMEGDLLRRLEAHWNRIGHVQIADNPGRGEPGSGEINFRTVLRTLDELGYRGRVGCEYRPVAGTLDGLAWATPYLEPAGRSP